MSTHYNPRTVNTVTNALEALTYANKNKMRMATACKALNYNRNLITGTNQVYERYYEEGKIGKTLYNQYTAQLNRYNKIQAKLAVA